RHNEEMDPLVSAILTVLAGGLICYFIRQAPAIEPPFKQWAVWLVAAGTVWLTLARLGALGGFRRTLGG
ncbi:MAG: hypothetical protein V4641_24285, partial [Pseudomonadota bacterium]